MSIPVLKWGDVMHENVDLDGDLPPRWNSQELEKTTVPANVEWPVPIDGDTQGAQKNTDPNRSNTKSLPPRPQLKCSQCDFHDDEPARLAEHLIRVHGRTVAEAWFEAGQENERLYPRFRAPDGTFSVIGVDKNAARGAEQHCDTLGEAIEIAKQAEGAYPEISVFDSGGKEVYKARKLFQQTASQLCLALSCGAQIQKSQ